MENLGLLGFKPQVFLRLLLFSSLKAGLVFGRTAACAAPGGRVSHSPCPGLGCPASVMHWSVALLVTPGKHKRTLSSCSTPSPALSLSKLVLSFQGFLQSLGLISGFPPHNPLLSLLLRNCRLPSISWMSHKASLESP